MGVHGLQSLMYQNNFRETVNLADIAEAYRKETGIHPVLLIDISSCIIFLYKEKSGDIAGELKKFEKTCEEFLNAFHNIKIQLMIIGDGLKPKDKTMYWIKRNNRAVSKLRSAYSASQINGLGICRAPLMGIALEVFSSSNKCLFRRALYEADDLIAQYMKQENYFGVLSNDTDFLLMEGSWYCLSIRDLNLREMTTSNFSKYKLAEYLNLSVSQLPFWGTICPNHVITEENLFTFYSRKRIRFFKRFKTVAKFVQTHFTKEQFFNSLNSYLNDYQMEKIRNRVESLCGKSSEELRLGNDKNWNDVLVLAMSKHQDGSSDKMILEILLNRVFFAGVVCENVGMNTPDEALQKFRKKIYGFLFFEYPEEVSVTEHLYALPVNHIMVSYFCQDVTFEKRKHVTFLSLWASNPTPEIQELKYEYFCKIVSEKLDPKVLLSKVKEEFIFPLLAVFYLECEMKKFLDFELEALLVQSVQANQLSADEVSSLNVEPVIEAVNLFGWFFKVLQILELLNSACGNPFNRKKTKTVNYVDGLLLHKVYGHLKNNINMKEYLTPESYTIYCDLKDVLKTLKRTCGFVG